jgi:hypothetical protein
MKSILIIDDMQARRDPARFDMYRVMVTQMDAHICRPPDLPKMLASTQYDVLFFGMYHQWPLTPADEINWQSVVALHRGRIILDQCDNEEYLSVVDRVEYLKDYDNKVLTARYLPNDAITEAATRLNCEVKLLRWYVDPLRFKPRQKEIKCALIGAPQTRRFIWQQLIKDDAIKNFYTAIYQPIYGTLYAEALSLSDVLVVESGRKAFTLKYIEGVLSGCKIVGDKPLYPENDLQGFWCGDASKLMETIGEANESPLPNNLEAIYKYTSAECLIANLNELL